MARKHAHINPPHPDCIVDRIVDYNPGDVCNPGSEIARIYNFDRIAFLPGLLTGFQTLWSGFTTIRVFCGTGVALLAQIPSPIQ
jgi:hypothetical protein